MATIGNLIINIGAKIDGLRKGLSDSTSLIQGAKSKIQSLGGVIGSGIKTAAVVGAGALLTIGVGAATLGPQLVGLGSDAEEMLGKFNVVFAQTGAGVTDSLTEFGAQVGRNKFELMGYAATLGDTLKPMGFTEEAAASTSVELVKLATDLSSFNNMPMDEALGRLQGTLIGSHENALAFGVVINENTLKAELAKNGWDELTGAQLEAAKVQARINLLMQGTTDAQGDAARTSGSWANQMRALQATLTQTGTEIGLKLLPVLTPLLVYLGTLARDYLPGLVGLIAQWIPKLVETGSAIGQRVMPWLQALGDWAVNVGWPALQQLAAIFDRFITLILPPLQQAWQTLVSVWQTEVGPALDELWAAVGELLAELGLGTGKTDLWQIALGLLKTALTGVVTIVHLLTPAIRLAADIMVFLIGQVKQGIENFIRFKNGVEGIIDAVNRLIGRIGDLASDLIDLAIPDWLRPGSPTPFELGLRGIARAIDEMPGLNVGVGGQGSGAGGLALAGASAGGGGITIGPITINANSKEEGEAAGRGFVEELRRRGLL
jgi:hypothetical protein